MNINYEWAECLFPVFFVSLHCGITQQAGRACAVCRGGTSVRAEREVTASALLGYPSARDLMLQHQEPPKRKERRNGSEQRNKVRDGLGLCTYVLRIRMEVGGGGEGGGRRSLTMLTLFLVGVVKNMFVYRTGGFAQENE